jgi:copper chaperone CopZ
MAIALDIDGMTCSHCVRAVTTALKSIRGIAAAP